MGQSEPKARLDRSLPDVEQEQSLIGLVLRFFTVFYMDFQDNKSVNTYVRTQLYMSLVTSRTYLCSGLLQHKC